MDPRDFADVFSVRMGVLYEAMCADPDALTVAAHLVQSTSVGRTFNALLAEYLTQHKLQLLAEPSHKVGWRVGVYNEAGAGLKVSAARWDAGTGNGRAQGLPDRVQEALCEKLWPCVLWCGNLKRTRTA